MRVQGKPARGPSWVVAIVAFMVLLVVLQAYRNQGRAQPLTDRFASGRPSPASGGLSLPPLPSALAGLASTAVARLAGGHAVAALTPVAQNAALRVEIAPLEPVAQGLRIKGQALNVGTNALQLSLGNFRFVDDRGTVYTTENSAATTLTPGQRVPLDLTLPITQTQQLSLEVEMEGQPKINMILLQAK